MRNGNRNVCNLSVCITWIQQFHQYQCFIVMKIAQVFRGSAILECDISNNNDYYHRVTLSSEPTLGSGQARSYHYEVLFFVVRCSCTSVGEEGVV